MVVAWFVRRKRDGEQSLVSILPFCAIYFDGDAKSALGATAVSGNTGCRRRRGTAFQLHFTSGIQD